MPTSSLFILRGVNIEDIIRKYYLPPVKEKSTPVPYFDSEEKDICIFFLSPYKENIKYWITMKDLEDDQVLPHITSLPCGWCQENFDTPPIGCPIQYHGEKDEVEYPLEKKRFDEYLQRYNLNSSSNDWIETEGMFCSFPCTKAYIFDRLDRSNSIKYANSLTLLTLMYYIFYGEVINIPIAAPRKQLVRWGGCLDAARHRKSFGEFEYVKTGNLRRPMLYSSSEYILEKKIKM